MALDIITSKGTNESRVVMIGCFVLIKLMTNPFVGATVLSAEPASYGHLLDPKVVMGVWGYVPLPPDGLVSFASEVWGYKKN